MKAKIQLTQAAYIEECATIRKNDPGRILDHVTSTVFVIGFLVGLAGYYVFGPNLISHGAVACFVYWFLLRDLILKLIRKNAFSKLAIANKELSYLFDDEGMTREIEGEDKVSFAWEELTRVVQTDKGIQVDAGKQNMWLPAASFTGDDEFAKAAELLQQKVKNFKK